MNNNLHDYLTNLPDNTIRYGTDTEVGEPEELSAGCMDALFENGALRYLKVGSTEVVRMVYSAVRGKGWITVPGVISNLVITKTIDSFHAAWDCRYIADDIDFMARYIVEGDAGNTIIFTMEGEALSGFMKSRIGFCILHPITGIPGSQCRIIHSNLQEEWCTFPVAISRHQPFKDIAAMEWDAGENVHARLVFEGDVFETEDQRNWTDASYKTYCTPLDLPYPVWIEKGQRIDQRVVLTVEAAFEKTKSDENEVAFFPVGNMHHKIPKLGLMQSTRVPAASEDELKSLSALGIMHYRTDVYLFKSNWEAGLKKAADEACILGSALEVVLFFPDNHAKELAGRFCKLVAEHEIRVERLLVLHEQIQATPQWLMETVYPLFKNEMKETEVGCGTNANFAQLNRFRPEGFEFDFIAWAIHPQEHASDHLTLVENIGAQADTVATAKGFSGNKPVYVSPLTIQRRFNANTGNFEQPVTGNQIPWQIDSRQMSLFGVAWTAGSLGALFTSGVTGITLFETLGERGIAMGQCNSRWIRDFKAKSGMFFPVFHLIAFLAGLREKGYMFVPFKSTHPLKAGMMCFQSGENKAFILFNHTHSPLKVNISQFSGIYRMVRLNCKSYTMAGSSKDWSLNPENMSQPAPVMDIVLMPNETILAKAE